MPRASETLSPREFDQITELAYRTCGIDLKNGKQELVQARLGKKIRQGKFESFKQYYEHVVADKTGEELIALLDALTTNFTSFLREATPFRVPAQDHPAFDQRSNPNLERGLLDRRRALHHRLLPARRARNVRHEAHSHPSLGHIDTRARHCRAWCLRSGAVQGIPAGMAKQVSAARLRTSGRLVSG
jgi:hypothetical protein